MRFLLYTPLLYTLFFTASAQAQTVSDSTARTKYSLQSAPESAPRDTSVQSIRDAGEPVSVMPEFPGGQSELMAYLSKNIRYPDKAVEEEIQGKVYIGFTVDEKGYITDVKVTRGIGGGCDEEAVRVVKAMPRWKPGTQNGRAVKTMYNLPVRFQLN